MTNHGKSAAIMLETTCIYMYIFIYVSCWQNWPENEAFYRNMLRKKGPDLQPAALHIILRLHVMSCNLRRLSSIHQCDEHFPVCIHTHICIYIYISYTYICLYNDIYLISSTCCITNICNHMQFPFSCMRPIIYTRAATAIVLCSDWKIISVPCLVLLTSVSLSFNLSRKKTLLTLEWLLHAMGQRAPTRRDNRLQNPIRVTEEQQNTVPFGGCVSHDLVPVLYQRHTAIHHESARLKP